MRGPTLDPERASRVCLALMRIGTRLAASFDQNFAAHGLTQAQFRVLIAAANLGTSEQATPSNLADLLLIERSTVSLLLKQLLARRLLSRQRGGDRRSYRVELTTKGWETLRGIKPLAIAAADVAMSGVAPTALPRLEALLAAVERHLRTLTR